MAEFAAIVVWSAFILLTVRKFWRSSTDKSDAELYGKVKVSGIFVTCMSSLYTPTAFDFPKMSYWTEVIFWAIILFPAAMWSTYLGLRWFHAIVDR